MPVDVLIEDDRWKALALEPLAKSAFVATMKDRGLDPKLWEVALLAANDARIAALNADFRGKPTPTNVLSWPSEERGAEEDGADPEPPAWDGDAELGDIALAYDTCAREAENGGLALKHHVTHLIVHGLLHLLGYDHERDRDGDLMESRETAILAKLGVADPYASS